MKNLTLYSIALFCTLFINSCSSDDGGETSSNNAGLANLTLKLTDAPADYDEVNIDIQEITIHTANGWENIEFDNPGVYNLLDFNNGMDTLMTRAEIPAGNVSQMRLILGENNTIVVDGTTHDLRTPSAQQSGLKFNIHQDFEAGTAYELWIDFDAGNSIVEQGNGGYSLRPVIKTFTDLTNGQIRGYVYPANANTTIYVMDGDEIVAVGIPEDDGYFLIRGLEESTYSILFDTDNDSFTDSTMDNIVVSFGEINDIGSITLQ